MKNSKIIPLLDLPSLMTHGKPFDETFSSIACEIVANKFLIMCNNAQECNV